MLPAGSTEIEYDPLSGRAFSQFPNGSFSGQEFEIDTGAGIGLPIFNGASHTGQEWVGTDLYAAAILGGAVSPRRSCGSSIPSRGSRP